MRINMNKFIRMDETPAGKGAYLVDFDDKLKAVQNRLQQINGEYARANSSSIMSEETKQLTEFLFDVFETMEK
jgi:hypothetical protein